MKKGILYLLSFIPFFRLIVKSRFSQTPVRFKHILGYIKWRFVKRSNVYWPVHSSSLVLNARNIVIGVDTCPGYMPGCYIQGSGGIVIGDYTQIACNVGLVSQNHDLFNLSRHIQTRFPSITIGRYCWIGMNVTILPNVTIPDFCVVGAGSVVTKSVVDQGSVLVGNPARVIKKIDISKIKKFKNDNEFVGFMSRDSFGRYREQKLRL